MSGGFDVARSTMHKTVHMGFKGRACSVAAREAPAFTVRMFRSKVKAASLPQESALHPGTELLLLTF